MALTLTVETGNNVPNANSYISQADAVTYCTNWGLTAFTGAASQNQINALYYAAYGLDRLFGRFYLGKTAKHSQQSLLWPRQRYPHEETLIDIQDTTGAGALLSAQVIDGVITNVYIIEGGSGYTAPILTIYGGFGAALTANVTSGVITSVTINTPGNNYATPCNIIDNNGNDIAINAIPESLRDAQCELANLAVVSGQAALFPNENPERYLQQEIDEFGAGLNFRRQYFPKEATDIERYQGFRKIELILWNVMNRQMVVTL